MWRPDWDSECLNFYTRNADCSGRDSKCFGFSTRNAGFYCRSLEKMDFPENSWECWSNFSSRISECLDAGTKNAWNCLAGMRNVGSSLAARWSVWTSSGSSKCSDFSSRNMKSLDFSRKGGLVVQWRSFLDFVSRVSVCNGTKAASLYIPTTDACAEGLNWPVGSQLSKGGSTYPCDLTFSDHQPA